MDFNGARFAFTLFLNGLFDEVAHLIHKDRTLADPKMWHNVFSRHKRACLYNSIITHMCVGDTSAPVLRRQLMIHIREV